MAKLTAFSRLLIALLIVGGVYFAARTFLPQLQGKTDATTTTTTSDAGDNGNSASTGSTDAGSGDNTSAGSNSSFSRQTFNFTPTAPVNGKL